MQTSPRLKPRTVDKCVRAIDSLMMPGESIRALVGILNVEPLASALAVTTDRLIAFHHRHVERSQVAIVLGADISSFGFRSDMGILLLWVRAADSTETTLGRVHADDVEFVRQSVRQLQLSLMTGLAGPGRDVASDNESATYDLSDSPAVAISADELRARGAISLFGKPPPEIWWTMLKKHSPRERPSLIIVGRTAIPSLEVGLFAAFTDHLIIAKVDVLSSTAPTDIRIKTESFPFEQITHIEWDKASGGGALRVLCGPDGGLKEESENNANRLLIDRNTFVHATPSIHDLRSRVWATKPGAWPRPQASAVQNSTASPETPSDDAPSEPSPVPSHSPIGHPGGGQSETAPTFQVTQPSLGLAGEIAELAKLHQQGILDQEEFRAAKTAVIKRHS